MTTLQSIMLLTLLSVLVISQSQFANGLPASSFNYIEGDWYDNWGIDRNYYAGPDGYLPNIAIETLNENKELAYSIGEWFQTNYPSRTDRAVAILKYVQTWTEYGYDSDNVVRGGVPQEEWAWNADEMARAFNETMGVKAIGDCEDMAFLCGTIYIGGGFDAAIVDALEHVALLIWLPEFSNANTYWNLTNDDRDAGWIWVEATSSANPLGWTPPDFRDGGWTAYAIGNLEFVSKPERPQSTSFDIDITMVIVAIIFFIILAIAKGRRH